MRTSSKNISATCALRFGSSAGRVAPLDDRPLGRPFPARLQLFLQIEEADFSKPMQARVSTLGGHTHASDETSTDCSVRAVLRPVLRLGPRGAHGGWSHRGRAAEK